MWEKWQERRGYKAESHTATRHNKSETYNKGKTFFFSTQIIKKQHSYPLTIDYGVPQLQVYPAGHRIYPKDIEGTTLQTDYKMFNSKSSPINVEYMKNMVS